MTLDSARSKNCLKKDEKVDFVTKKRTSGCKVLQELCKALHQRKRFSSAVQELETRVVDLFAHGTQFANKVITPFAFLSLMVRPSSLKQFTRVTARQHYAVPNDRWCLYTGAVSIC